MSEIRERLWKKAGKQGIPLTAAFELLPVCNLSCKMCYVRKSMEDVRACGGLKDAHWWLQMAEEAGREGLLFPLLTGGEPFLHPEFREILAGMQKMGMQVTVNSNGTLIDRETASWLGNHVPTRINITLYGASEETYQNLCGNGDAYRRVRNAVQWLKEYRIPVKFNASITPENVDDLEKIIAYAREVESPVQVTTYMFPPVRRDDRLVGVNNRLSPEEAGLAKVKADYLQSDDEWFQGMARRFRNFVPLDQIDFTTAGRREIKMSCRAGHCSCWLDWQGNMVNCGMYGSVKIPMEDKHFSDAWRELRKQTDQMRYAPYCTICPNFWLCHTCIAMVSNECGDVDGRPEYLCRMNEAMSNYYQEYAMKADKHKLKFS